jgi:IS1 family transposase
LAKAARAKAEGVRKSATERQQKAQQEKFAKAWADSYNRLSEKETWLKDQNSAEYKRTVELLQRVPVLQSMPDGLVHAVELMKLQDSAAKAQSIESENKALKEQLNKLQQKTAIGKSIPAGQLKAEEKDFSKLSLKEQREALLKASRAFDREAD